MKILIDTDTSTVVFGRSKKKYKGNGYTRDEAIARIAREMGGVEDVPSMLARLNAPPGWTWLLDYAKSKKVSRQTIYAWIRQKKLLMKKATGRYGLRFTYVKEAE